MRAEFFTVAMIGACAVSSGTMAAPLTFKFNADVASVVPFNGDADLPFDVIPGDLVVATFRFEPGDDGPNYLQSETLRFEISGHVVDVPNYVVTVRDEYAPNAAPNAGRISDPLNAPIDDQVAGSSDNIFLGCISDQTFCGSLVGHHAIEVLPVIRFSTDDNPLLSDSLVANVDIWNQFSFREMSLSFRNNDSGGQVYIGANIRAVEQVPEIGTGCMALLGTAACAILSMNRARRNS
jgi:hypothetical protein